MSHRGRGRGRLSQLKQSNNSRISQLCRTDRSQWVNQCRRNLLDMETRNIQRRASHWTDLVNDKVRDTNRRLNFNAQRFTDSIKKFKYNVSQKDMEKHLNFIINWKGLKTRQIQNAPKTYPEFENKAKNWLNGRRAPNYAATLFPDMIKAAEIYADNVSRELFSNQPNQAKLYCKICIIGFLSSLCSARISLNDASKKAYLICENSVKTGKTQVSQILQRYASDHPYPDKFPSHLREASDFFENKYMDLVSDFGIALHDKELSKKKRIAIQNKQFLNQTLRNHDSNSSDTSQSNNNSPSIHSTHSNGSQQNRNRSRTVAGRSSPGLPPSNSIGGFMDDITKVGDGNTNAISMSIDQFNKLATFLSSMIENQRTQQATINDLVGRVSSLETQQKGIINDINNNHDNNLSSSSSPRNNNNSLPRLNSNTTNNSSHSPSSSTPRSSRNASLISPYGAGLNNNRNIHINGNMMNMNAINMNGMNGINPMNMNMNNMNMNFINGQTDNYYVKQHYNQQQRVQTQQPPQMIMPFDNPQLNAFESTASSNTTMNSLNHMHGIRHIQPQQLPQQQLAQPPSQRAQPPPPQRAQQQQQQHVLNNLNNGSSSPHTETTNTTISNNAQQPITDGPYGGNSNNNNNNNNMIHPLNQNQIQNLHKNNNASSTYNMSNAMNMNQSMLPTTSLLGAGAGGGSYESNDGDTQMYFLNNTSFNSSDAGMNGMLSVPNTTQNNGITASNSLNEQIPLEGGYMSRFSDNSLNLSSPTIANITNISNISVYNNQHQNL